MPGLEPEPGQVQPPEGAVAGRREQAEDGRRADLGPGGEGHVRPERRVAGAGVEEAGDEADAAEVRHRQVGQDLDPHLAGQLLLLHILPDL